MILFDLFSLMGGGFTSIFEVGGGRPRCVSGTMILMLLWRRRCRCAETIPPGGKLMLPGGELMLLRRCRGVDDRRGRCRVVDDLISFVFVFAWMILFYI